MSLRDSARKAWQRFAHVAYAMDYDERAVMDLRVKRLEAALQKQRSDLTEVSARVDGLGEEILVLSGQRDLPGLQE